LINDCIAQYLEYNGYQSTLTVLKAETANAKGREAVKSKRRRAMEQALKQQWEQYQQDYLGTDSNLPVLYSILSFIPNDSSIQPEIHLPIPLPLEAAELTNRERLAADAAPLSSSDSFESYHSNDQ
jgi:hypothetical protein